MKPSLTLLTALLLAPIAALQAADPGNSQSKPQTGFSYELFGGPAAVLAGDRPAKSGFTPHLEAMEGGNDWGLRFTGQLTPLVDGDYAFRAEANTGVRVKIDGKLIIDGWAQDGARNGTATLIKAKPVALVVEYFCVRTKGGKPELRLFWTPPGGQEQRLPPAPLEVRGEEQARINRQLPDGGLKPVVGVQNIQVFRSCRGKPELADGDGWTFAHHHDMAAWKGRLYVAWAMTPKDEDVPPYKVVYATSTDGFHWSVPVDLFPRKVAWACRFYFYRATNGRMLAFCAGQSAGKAAHSVLLVREIMADHRLGDVFTLIGPSSDQPPSFETATDAGFVAACREAMGNNLLLEQQDYGLFLGDRRMKWHDDQELNGVGFWKFGKALCFYHVPDGGLIGLSKMGYATLSNDEGKTWSRPVQPPSLFAGSGKIWGQRTADGRYALAYNPDPNRNNRYPLAVVRGDDGLNFRDMRVVHGELNLRRFSGLWKLPGPQYVRGLAEWADDGTFADTKEAMWLVYSVNKEDIWVSRVPLPVKPDETAFPSDDFAKATPNAVVPGWNLYSPKWAPASVVENAGKRALELRDGDPFDYARAVRVFPESAKVRAELELTPAQTSAGLEIDLCDAVGRRPVRVLLTETGLVQAVDGNTVTDLGKYAAGEKLSLTIAADATAGRYSVQVNGGSARELAVAEADAKTLQRLSLRTGAWRTAFPDSRQLAEHLQLLSPRTKVIVDSKGEVSVEPAADVPLPTPAVFQIQRVRIAAP